MRGRGAGFIQPHVVTGRDIYGGVQLVLLFSLSPNISIVIMQKEGLRQAQTLNTQGTKQIVSWWQCHR